MNRIAENIVGMLLNKKYIEEEEKDFYVFTFESIFIAVINYVTMMIMAALLDKVIECIILVWLLKMLRGNMGGIHMSKWYTCYVVSNIIIMISLLCIDIVNISLVVIMIIIVLCLHIVIRFAPYVNQDNPIERDEIKKYKVKSIVYTSIIGSGAILLKCIKSNKYTNLCVIALCMSTFLLYIGKKKQNLIEK